MTDISTCRRNPTSSPRSRIWIPAIGSLLAVPAWSSFILANDPTIAAISLFAEYLVAECWIGPTLAVLYGAVPSNRRGTTQGIFSILVALGNTAPYIVGLLTGGSLASFPIGSTIMWVVGIAYFISGIAFAATAWKEDQILRDRWLKKTDNNNKDEIANSE
jgi:peptidoglycan/LPS O-acetylase OafA/YrhL